MSSPTVAIVTGVNRGIGEAICHTLANGIQKPFILYAASRKGVDLGIDSPHPTTQIKYPRLDITDYSSIQSLAALIEKEHGTLDVLINNAGVNLNDEYSPITVKQTLDTNYRGTLHMCQVFLPLLKKDGRIVNVSSVASNLERYSEGIKQQFRNPNLTLQDLEVMMEKYQSCVDQGTERQNGWPRQAYGVSKACENAFTAVLARENPGLAINACCPGWVSTDMGRLVGTPSKTAMDGAKIPVRLGFKDIGGITGRYWANPSVSVSGRGEGDVQAW